MKKIKKVLRILAFVCLILLATVGIGIPIPFFYRDEFDKFYIEQIEEGEEREDSKVK